MSKVGYSPTKVEMKTCGQGSGGGAWNCKKHTYGRVLDGLTVYFEQSPADGKWRVNSWDVYP
jgi:hypothetical protein